MDKYKVNEVKSYKWNNLKEDPPKNAVLYVLDPITKEIELFITDKKGVPRTIKSIVPQINISNYVKQNIYNEIEVENNQLFVKKYNSGDEYIEIENSPIDYKIKLNVDKIELVENKQNNLNPDGTGTKYPTVDAVNQKFEDIEDQMSNVSVDKNFVYEQMMSSNIWDFTHPLEKEPSVTTLDSAGSTIMGKVTIMGNDRVIVEFNHPMWGKAILN